MKNKSRSKGPSNCGNFIWYEALFKIGKFKGVRRHSEAITFGKSKIPLQNNGTLAYYKNILYLNFAAKPTPNWERSWVAALFLSAPKSFTSSS